ncbi:hypothetical protein HMPREF9564_01453 [Cutibacterium acnes HL053PA1]|nr:hypothetical protein HMPREF9564_01453 [Cutibacterium acnes HL053PA1]EFT53069.1 hypothetical protein HMPREF9569_01397 [Cutibacterium acnes HL078PA1]EFT61628.1 hypothetical protein HMPREF9572_02470 [Cutibacterium acnes HL072PA1]
MALGLLRVLTRRRRLPMMPMLWWGYSVSAWVPTLILLSGSR